MKVEEIVEELLSLARRKPLSDEVLNRAKELMGELKKMGYTNREISELTDGNWAEPTIKSYTRGIRVEDPNQKERATKLLVEMVKSGVSLDDVEETIFVKQELESKGLSVGEVSELLGEAEKSNINVKELIELYEKLKGVGIEKLKELSGYITELRSKRLKPEDIRPLYEACEKYGGYEAVMRAVNSYGSLEELKNEVDGLRSSEEDLKGRIDDMKLKVSELDKRKKGIEGALSIYERLGKRGWDEDALAKLEKASKGYGGVKEVLDAINAYRSIDDINQELSELEIKKRGEEVKLKELEADNAHLMDAIRMSKELIYKHGFSVSSITGIYKLAKKYGVPSDLLEALEKYGSIKELDDELKDKTERAKELKSKINKLQSDLGRLRTTKKELEDSISRSLKPISEEFIRATKALGDTYNKYLSKAEEVGRRYKELESFEQERGLLLAMRKALAGSKEAKEIPLEYLYAMANALLTVCSAKKINPEISILGKRYGELTSVDVPLIKVIKEVRDELQERITYK